MPTKWWPVIEAKVLPKKSLKTFTTAGRENWARSRMFEVGMWPKAGKREIIPARLLKARFSQWKPLYDEAKIQQKIDYDENRGNDLHDRSQLGPWGLSKECVLNDSTSKCLPVGGSLQTAVIYPNGEPCYAAWNNYYDKNKLSNYLRMCDFIRTALSCTHSRVYIVPRKVPGKMVRHRSLKVQSEEHFCILPWKEKREYYKIFFKHMQLAEKGTPFSRPTFSWSCHGKSKYSRFKTIVSRERWLFTKVDLTLKLVK